MHGQAGGGDVRAMVQFLPLMARPEEEARLLALESYAMLDSPADPAFERLVRITADALRAPAAALELVDRDCQVSLAGVKVERRETRRQGSFASHAVERRGLLVVKDALGDERFPSPPLLSDVPASTRPTTAPAGTKRSSASAQPAIRTRSWSYR